MRLTTPPAAVPRRAARFLACAGVGASLACATTGAAQRRPASTSALPSRPVEVALTPYLRALPTVPVTRDRDTLTFLLDTGGGYTVLSHEGAHRLGCAPTGHAVAHRMDGQSVAFQWCDAMPLALGGVPLDAGRIAVLDLAALLPPGLPPLDGLLSMRSFAGRVVSIDLPAARLVLESAGSAARIRSRAEPLVARIASGHDGAASTVLLAARVEAAPLWLLLDSGNLLGTLLAPHAVPALAPVSPSDGSRHVTLEVRGLPARTESVHVRHLIYDGVLGATFMAHGRFTFDLRGSDPWVGVQRATASSPPARLP